MADPGGPDISAYYRLPGMTGNYPYKWARLDAPLTLTVDPNANPHIGIDPNALPSFGQGFIVASSQGMPPQVFLDTAIVPIRVTAPISPGPCVDPVTGQPHGSAVWAADATHFYFAVQNADGSGFIWARTVLDHLVNYANQS